MAQNQIHSTVREGSTLYMPDNQEHADNLCALLPARSCYRLVASGIVSGDGFEAKAAEYGSTEVPGPAPVEPDAEPEVEVEPEVAPTDPEDDVDHDDDSVPVLPNPFDDPIE